jgi:hypothetical protein
VTAFSRSSSQARRGAAFGNQLQEATGQPVGDIGAQPWQRGRGAISTLRRGGPAENRPARTPRPRGAGAAPRPRPPSARAIRDPSCRARGRPGFARSSGGNATEATSRRPRRFEAARHVRPEVAQSTRLRYDPGYPAATCDTGGEIHAKFTVRSPEREINAKITK